MNMNEFKDTVQWIKNTWIIQLFVILAIALIKIIVCGVTEVLGVIGAVLFFSTTAMFVFFALLISISNSLK